MSNEPAFFRFDGAFAWSRLSHDERDRIGTIALEVVCAWHLQDANGSGPEPILPSALARVAGIADTLMMGELERAVFDTLPADAFMATGHDIPRVPALIGGICRRCGCTQNDACPGGCGWAAEDLCTACAKKPPAA